MEKVEAEHEVPKAIVGDELPGIVSSAHLFLEGPVWHPEQQALIFSDIAGDKMLILQDGVVGVYRQPSNKANGNAFDRVGRLITCEHATSRLVREEPDGALTVLASSYQGSQLNSPNDVIVDAGGNVYFTDPTYGRMEFFGVPRDPELAHRGVYKLIGGQGPLLCIADDFDQPNGLCLSLDGKYLYVNDSERRHIRRFEVQSDSLLGGEVWTTVPGEGGPPDGMKFDAEGNLYCTGPGGVHVFDEGANLLGVIPVPEQVGNFNWGGDDLMTLYFCASSTLYSVRVLVPGPQN